MIASDDRNQSETQSYVILIAVKQPFYFGFQGFILKCIAKSTKE